MRPLFASALELIQIYRQENWREMPDMSCRCSKDYCASNWGKTHCQTGEVCRFSEGNSMTVFMILVGTIAVSAIWAFLLSLAWH